MTDDSYVATLFPRDVEDHPSGMWEVDVDRRQKSSLAFPGILSTPRRHFTTEIVTKSGRIDTM
jgi:hypothetical protein